MPGDTGALRAYFFKLGLSSEIADIYLALNAYGPQTISELARSAGIERTRIYRLMDELKNSNLIEIETQYKKNVLHAAPIGNLQILLTKNEQTIHDLRDELGDLQERLASHGLESEMTKVQAYRGEEGLKQMFWNQTRAKTENLSILYENMQGRTNLAFFERWAQTCNQRKLTFRGIISDHFLATQQEWYRTHQNERLKQWQARYVQGSVFPITHSTVIYNDVTSYYNWKNDEVFGIEIYNQEIADAQRQFFELLWSQAPPVNDLVGVPGQA